jgi:putative membrane protein
MIKFILYFVVMAAVMLGLAHVLPGFEIASFGSALIAAIVLGLMNAIVKPILFVITLPFTILTLGLFLFVLNAIVLWLTALLVPGFRIHGFLTALLAALILSVVGMIWKSATRKTD